MKKIIILFLVSSFLITACKEECKINNPANISYKGCGGFMVFDKILISGLTNSYISIQMERDDLSLNEEFQSFEIQNNSSITSAIKAFNKEGNNYCTDALIYDLQVVNSWIIQSGTIDLRIVREKSECDDTYVVDAILKNAVYKDSNNNEITITKKEFLNIIVNYILG